MQNHPVVSQQEWLAARLALLVKEKQATQLRDRLNAERLAWNRHLAAAFRSPVTTARFRAAIPGSKFPAYRFDALLNYQQSRSARGYFALPG